MLHLPFCTPQVENDKTSAVVAPVASGLGVCATPAIPPVLSCALDIGHCVSSVSVASSYPDSLAKQSLNKVLPKTSTLEKSASLPVLRSCGASNLDRSGMSIVKRGLFVSFGAFHFKVDRVRLGQCWLRRLNTGSGPRCLWENVLCTSVYVVRPV